VIVEDRAPVADASRQVERSGGAMARTRWTPLALVLAVLPVAALTEVALMRTFYRVGIYIPKEEPFRGTYRTLTAIGSFAMNLSMVLATLALVLLAGQAWRRGLRAPAMALGAFVASSLLVRVSGVEVLGPLAWLIFVLAAVAVGWPFVRGSSLRRGTWIWHRATVGGVLASVMLSAWAAFSSGAGALVFPGAGADGAVEAQLAAEALVVATAFSAFAAWIATQGVRVRPLLVGALAALGLLVAWRANGAVTGILVLWTAGLRMYLPIPLYALALGGFTAAAAGFLPRHGWRSAGLALLLVAGMLLESTYLQGLALLALVLLTDGAAVGGLPELARAEAPGTERR
jgi:hypothetical protein